MPIKHHLYLYFYLKEFPIGYVTIIIDVINAKHELKSTILIISTYQLAYSHYKLCKEQIYDLLKSTRKYQFHKDILSIY